MRDFHFRRQTTHNVSFCRALRGATVFERIVPRVWPWAIVDCPSGARIANRQDRRARGKLLAGFAITQAQEQQLYASGQVLTDVRDAYEGWRVNDEIVGLYRSGYLDDAQQSRDITDYAYRRGAASLLDFLDAERSFRATQLGYRQSLASYLQSLEQLREAVGTRSLP